MHSPSGSVLPNRARSAVAALSEELGFAIVDHVPAMDTLIDGSIPLPLAAYGGAVITIGSASKAFWGGLRVGWIRADASTLNHFTVVKCAEDLGTSIPAQVVTARLLRRADEARAYGRATLGAARALVLETLAERLPRWRPLPPRQTRSSSSASNDWLPSGTR